MLTAIYVQSYNEQLRLSERRLHFDINELHDAIAKSVGQHSADIVLFTKISECGSYRIFEATFHDGLKVIARLPYLSTIPRKYGIASEVAIIEFLYIYGVLTLKIFDWSLLVSNNIGSEYIIMERVQGTELVETWYDMTFN